MKRLRIQLYLVLPAYPFAAAWLSHHFHSQTTTTNTKLHSSSSTDAQTGQPFPYANQLFPGAVSYQDILDYVPNRLEQYGYSRDTTLCATSLCGDEMNRPLEVALGRVFHSTYSMGGLAGFPFGGITAFKKLKDHTPTGGSCLVVYGPHVGLSSDGRIGHVDRRGVQSKDKEHTMCCRSAILAADHVTQVFQGQAQPMALDPLDSSQYYVVESLTPYAQRLLEQAQIDEASQMLDLPYILMETQTNLMNRIIQDGSQFGFPGDVAVLGGIQINTPPGFMDYYVPLRFDLYNEQGQFCANLLEQQQQKELR